MLVEAPLVAPPVPATVPPLSVPVVTNEEEYRRDVLLRAAELIEQYGWTHGVPGMRVGGPYCLAGAVAKAANSRDWRGLLTHYDAENIVGVTYTAMYEWNDTLFYHWRNRPKVGPVFRRRRLSPEEMVTTALRRLANGATWQQATRF